MTTLHTFGCSITQGFALPDVVKPVLDADGQPLTKEQIQQQGIVVDWEDIHLYQPSDWAWPKILADRLELLVINHARRGACFQQIARQCAVAAPSIKQGDLVIVMWTYFSRISLQWPARTSVPLCNVVDASYNWRSKILPGFNRFFGLSGSRMDTLDQDQQIYQYIHDHALPASLEPMGLYNRYYNNLILLTMTDGFLRARGAEVIHLSVEVESYLDQLEAARQELTPSLKSPYVIPVPESWYSVAVDHDLCRVIHDPTIPPAENDMHPSIAHHKNFALAVYNQYFG